MVFNKEDVSVLADELKAVSPEEVLQKAVELFPGKIVLASSLAIEDQVILDMIMRLELAIPAFTLDTGRLFPETYDLLNETEEKYGRCIKVMFPDAAAVEDMVAEDGINLFRKSTELRKKCCGIRKIEPLKRALAGHDAWVCGLRQDQSDYRSDTEVVQWDAGQNMVKFNPLYSWNEQDVRMYVKQHSVPYNPLHDRGFKSIGCACCTRAVKEGEDFRAGRWWWEDSHKECGLHWVDGKPVRAKNI